MEILIIAIIATVLLFVVAWLLSGPSSYNTYSISTDNTDAEVANDATVIELLTITTCI